MSNTDLKIFPVFDKIVQRHEKENFLGQKSKVIWFTGITSPFETPQNPDIIIDTDELNIDQSLDKLYDFILPRILNK